MKSLVSIKNEISAEWGWKELKPCLFSKQYLELLANTCLLVVYRHFAAVMDSLIRRDMKGLRAAYGSLIGSIKWMFLKDRIKSKFVSELLSTYLWAWTVYNWYLLDMICSIPVEHTVVLDPQSFLGNDQLFLAQMRRWGFKSLKAIPFSNMFAPSSLSSVTHLPTKLAELATVNELLKSPEERKALSMG